MTGVYQESDFLSGDVRSFEYFFRKYYRLLVSFSFAMLEDKGKAEDIVQSLFTDLWEKKSNIQVQGKLKSYLLVSCRNRCIDVMRGGHNVFEDLQKAESISDESGISLELKETEKVYKDAVRSLSPKCRIAFVLCRFEGFSYKETAELMGVTEKTIEKHIGKALKCLRESMLNYREEGARIDPLLMILFGNMLIDSLT